MNSNKQTDLTQLTAKLRQEDESYARLSKNFKRVYWGLAIAYLLLSVLYFTIETSSFSKFISNICFFLTMLVFVFIFGKLHRDFKNVCYSLPTLEMLKKAKARYAPFGGVRILILLPILLINISGCVTFPDLGFVTFQLIYFGGVLLVVLTGLLYWKVRYKPLYDNISSLIKELNR